MNIRYWIYDPDLKEVNATEYYAFNGKKITTSGMGIGWELLMGMLLRYRYMKER